MKLSTTWKHWIKHHINSEMYMRNFHKILLLLDTEKYSPSGCFDMLESRLNSLILLTLSTENSITCSFYHEKFGDPILEESLTSVGLCGFGEKAFPTKIEVEKVLKSSSESYSVPLWEDFMKVEKLEDLDCLVPSVSKKIKSFALLPPFLSRVVLDIKNPLQKPIYYIMTASLCMLCKICYTIILRTQCQKLTIIISTYFYAFQIVLQVFFTHIILIFLS